MLKALLNRCHIGDCLQVLREFPDGFVNTCVTSPPYFGLRDYGHEGQIGLEPTPDEYVAKLVEVFREVRRVLRDDGTLWLNLGDSYNNFRSQMGPGQAVHGRDKLNGKPEVLSKRRGWGALKDKDLIGIPWRVAFALQQPYYTGRIRAELDRVWLAAMIDAEGCLFIHKRKAGSDTGAKFTRADGTDVSYARKSDTYGVGLEICNTSLNIIERIQQITGVGTVTTQSPEQNGRRKQLIYRWRAQPNECRRIVQEVYPHLVAKQHQARILLGCPSTGERAEAAHQALMGLHRGVLTDVDFAAPASLFERGYYLRQDVIWAKSNPVPESVRDRCTKAHEYLFLLSKSERYYFDAEAMQEPAKEWHGRAATFDRGGNEVADHIIPGQNAAQHRPRPSVKRGEFNGKTNAMPGREAFRAVTPTRNRRSVWTVATRPYKGAHFATYPPELVEPCVLAGSPEGGVVLDPFFGSGTTGQVAERLGRAWVGVEVNPSYVPLQRERLQQMGLILAEEGAA